MFAPFFALADFIVYRLLQLDPQALLATSLHFFIYDTLKIFTLLATIIFAVAIIRSYFPPERTRRILAHKREYVGNVLAALLGVVTPFCSCSAVPLFIGFVESVTSSIASELAMGKTLDEVLAISPATIAAALGGLPNDKMHCSNLASSALRTAVTHYRAKLVEETSSLSKLSEADNAPL
jgi:hypothetical protein